MIDEPYRVAEAALELGVHKTTLYQMIKEGTIEAYTVGTKHHCLRIERKEIDRYKKANKIKVGFA